ncbi:MAG: acylphosphatase [Thermoanaerobaculum sp.]|nr:acylphosphatase [Thermoanaerobaculum sp.]MDW7967036.1 acylphosphatase [Thermoanaerobaculum sp.]
MTRRFLVSGRVQGVGFRYFVFREAQRLGLSGFVRNLGDGRVEVVATGEEADLNRLEALLWRGPVMAHVTMVEVEEAEPANFNGFSIVSSRRGW